MGKFPLTNADLAGSDEYRGKDNFFNLVRIEKVGDVTHIHIDPTLQVVAKNDKFRDEVNTDAGHNVVLSRADVKSRNHDLGNNIRTLGVGVFPWLSMKDGEDRLALLQKDAGAPAAPLSFMQPAGLVAGDNPLSALFREFTEETGVIAVDDVNKQLVVQSAYLPREWEGAVSREAQDAIIARKPSSLAHIEKNIATHHPQYADYKVVFDGKPLESEALVDYSADKVVFYLPNGREIEAQGLICDDPVNNSFDYSVAIISEARHLDKVINVDPEVFGRMPKLASVDDIPRLDKVTAPLGAYRKAVGLEPKPQVELGDHKTFEI